MFAQICYVQQLGKYMIVSDLFLAGEGLQYVKAIFLNLNTGMIITLIFNIILVIIINIINRKNYLMPAKQNKLLIFILVIIALSIRLISYINLGTSSSYTWAENYNTKNIYHSFTNPNSSMYVSGFYEYHVRAIYKYIYNLVTLDKTTLKTTIDEYNDIYGIETQDNEYTGIFKDKNVIFIMMESIDSWIIDEDTMPTLSMMMRTGINFTNRYSPFFNGGQTINSEFALNTGLYAISDRKTIYDIDDVDYSYSLANMLKNNGYEVNSFHANTGEFYNRTNFHKKLGYTNHYSAADMQNAGILSSDKNYFSDSVFLGDDSIMNLFVSNNKFLSFYTTYSAHLEYIENNKVYKTVKKIKNKNYTEEEYIYRTLAHDTDEALSELIKYLKKNNLLDDTIIVLASDHYVYGYSNSDYVASKKNVINDKRDLQNTPFVIWANGEYASEVDTILDTADILPTLLNMLGIEYNPNNYLGTDVFSSYHDDFVWFSDGSYIKSKDCLLSNEAILTKSNYNINKNRNILLTNYYGKE
jgi:phosphoglycerol transferase MdoB-like AlkP superfamily enzyme